MMQIIAIALGGAFGAVARFLVANGLYAVLGRSFPHGTLFVNVSGSFLMGFLTELMLQRFPVAAEYRAAVMVGFLGAYTTFSTFALETLSLIEEGSVWTALLNVFLNLLLCLAAVWLGLIAGRTIFDDTSQPWIGHGLAHGETFTVLCGAFVLAAALSLFSEAVGSTPLQRAIGITALLGLTTVFSTLWLLFRLSEIRLGPHGLFGLFALNAFSGALLVWFGTLTGTWLWQHTLSR